MRDVRDMESRTSASACRNINFVFGFWGVVNTG